MFRRTRSHGCRFSFSQNTHPYTKVHTMPVTIATCEATDMTQILLDGLMSPESSPLDDSLPISHKGGHAGQAAREMKRMAISRLLGAGSLSIQNEKCDQFVARCGERDLPFSFRVTAKAKQSAWFNLSHREASRLAARGAAILVLFNPSKTDAESVWAFALPAERLCREVRRSLPQLVTNRLEIAQRQIAAVSVYLPDLDEDLAKLRHEDAALADDPDRSECLRLRGVELLREASTHGRPADISDDTWLMIRGHLASARETLESFLVYVHAPTAGHGPVVELPQANGRLYELPPGMARELVMGHEERQAIERALEDSEPRAERSAHVDA